MSLYLAPDHCRRIPIQGYYAALPVCYRPDTVSPQFVNTVYASLAAIPELLLQIMADRRFILILSGTLSEVHPELKMQKPRGHSQTSKYGNVHGLCCPERGHIHLTEYSGRLIARDARQTLKHEMGHAIDASVGAVLGFGHREVSSTFDFNQVFLKDVSQMTPATQRNLHYYIQQRSLAGRSEAFAEAMASFFGGGCEEASYFRHEFAHTTDWIERNILGHLGIATAAAYRSSRYPLHP